MKMIRSKLIYILAICVSFPISSYVGDDPIQKKYLFTSYLGCTEMETSTLDKTTFDSLIALPLCAKDSAKNIFPVQGFELTYAERGLYQDSSGLPIIFTDYSSERCNGNTLSTNWVNLFKERSYKGDTVFIENVKVLGADNKSHPAKGMRIIIK